ncbi:NADase-type glycan-binding domain-containing protein [Porphyromonas pogonae]|uniref:NADase-type glycan-binding domain-containing protein n=1 Tax=Porphyromonas pogonae TaxID=867595 RepID=UPI002E785031|nr:hypothetical protein [Porphyromonas pogonae]
MKRIATYISLTLLLATQYIMHAQDLPTLKAETREAKKFSKIESENWQKALDLFERINLGKMDPQSLSPSQKMMIDSLEQTDAGPLTVPSGCSWYCGGGPYKITASSTLKGMMNNTYKADNIHDFNILTAWGANNKINPIGQKVNFYFKPFSPRVTKIIIWNGYQKNTDLWKANSRVAKFKLLINNKPIAILELQDIINAQAFSIDPIQSTDKAKDMIITLEVMDIYKGDKYNDLMISEINFDGLDVHCFAPGTLITMADGTKKKIEDITTTDEVMTYDVQNNRLLAAHVKELIKARHTNLWELRFSKGAVITTDDHPFMLDDKSWASLNPEKSNKNYNQQSVVKKLSVGDKVYWNKGDAKQTLLIEIISKHHTEGLTYTLELESGTNFIANDMVVKTETIRTAKD